MSARSTIYALATGAPPTAIAIIRITGPGALPALASMTGHVVPADRRLSRRTLRHSGTGDLLDDGLVACFRAPASVTGDDLVELHLHGGVAVVAGVLDALAELGLAAALPGELTRRAFDNGKLDLAQVEALGDLLAATTVGQRRAALARTSTRLAGRVTAWRTTLLEVRADLEATLDFAEDDEVAAKLGSEQRVALMALRSELAQAYAEGKRASRLREGFVVALVGAVNTGKSTLLNALARRDAAIVSPVPGTTRDVIEVPLVLGGLPVTLVDTAGRRDTADPLEDEGIRRGIARAAGADLIVDLDGGPVGLAVRSKSDVRGLAAGWHDGVLHLSAATGDGLDLLEHAIVERLAGVARGESALVATSRQLTALADADDAVAAALAADDPLLAAEEMRIAISALAELIGGVTGEEVLGAVFARFCVGK